MKKYKVIHFPINTGNPYQSLIIKHIREHGFDARPAKGAGLLTPFFNAIIDFRIHIFHLHWQHYFLLGKTKFTTILKSLLFLLQLAFLRICGSKLVWTVHNISHHENKHRELELFFAKKIALLADKILVHCESAQETVQKAYNIVDKNKFSITYHGNYISYYKNSISRIEARINLNLGLDDFVFLYFGLLRSYKGVLELIDSFGTISSDKTKLIIAGQPMTKDLRRQLLRRSGSNPNIRLTLEYIPEDEIQIYMNAADIIVYPFLKILSSGSLLLAMSFGKPVIAPRIGCIKDLLDFSGGILYNPRQENALSEALLESMISKSKLSEMGQYNSVIASNYSWTKVSAATCSVYETVMNK